MALADRRAWRFLALLPPASLGRLVLRGKTILLYAEQGLGDTIQFIRYVSLVKNSGGNVLVECQPVLVSLLQSCVGVDRVLARGFCLPPFDVQSPLLSLPCILGTTLSTIPAHSSLLGCRRQSGRALAPDDLPPRAGLQNRHRLAMQERLPCGLQTIRALAAFAPLAALPGVHLFSLQKDSSPALTASAPFSVTDLGSHLQNFADTAAVLKNLDLLVTIDTAIAHCAGARAGPYGSPCPCSLTGVGCWSVRTVRWYPYDAVVPAKATG